MSLSRATLLTLALVMLAGCGFQPVYATRQVEDGSAQNAFAAFRGVQINQIDDREGQYLRNRLVRLIHPSGRSGPVTHSLTVTLSESTTSLAVARSAVASRANIRVSASVDLQAVTGREGEAENSFSNTFSATSGYNIFNSEFQTLAAEKGARERAINDLAEQIRLRLAAHLTATETATDGVR